MDVSQYLGIFLDEAKEHIQSLSDQMMTLEQEPDNQDAINEIFRAAHSLKGMAGTMGYKRLQRLTHDMEDVFSAVRSGQMKVKSNLMDVLFQALDAIEGYVDTIQNTSDEGDNDNEGIIKELNNILVEGTGQSVSEPAGMQLHLLLHPHLLHHLHRLQSLIKRTAARLFIKRSHWMIHR